MMTSQTGSRNSRGAFTLLEILVSVTILAVGVVAIMGAFDTSLSALSSSADRMRATFLMKEIMSSMDQEASGVPGSGLSGTDADFSWKVDVHPARRPSGAAVNEVVVSVWRHGKEQAAYSLATYARETSPSRR